MNDYLTVKEFAEAAGVSVQRIYQRLDTNLKPFIKPLNGKKMLSIEGLKLFEIKDLNEIQSSLEKTSLKKVETSTESNILQTTEISALNEKIQGLVKDLEKAENTIHLQTQNDEVLRQQLEAMQQQLTVKDEQLRTKDVQIAEKDKQLERLSSALESTTAALTAAQALHAGTIQERLTTEQHEPQSELNVPTPSEELMPTPESEQQPPKELAEDPAPQKLSFFQRLFRRK